MVRSFVCENGHTWRIAPKGEAATAVCPVCGSGADHSGSLDEALFPDELPPPPRTAMIGDDFESASSRTAAVGLVGDYELLAELGHGGMGVVYRARQVSLGRIVAVKMILAGEYADPQLRKRFRNEAETVARLQHPNIVQIHEVAEKDGRPFFSLEYIDGGSLSQKLATGPLGPKETAALVQVLAVAMQYAHERSVIHRDLKPANVMLTMEGTPKIADFGLARLLDDDRGQTKSGAILGTPSYMAPEQTRGEIRKIGPATDVYALGAVLYECLTGRPPFRAATALETAQQVLNEEPVSPARLQPGLPTDLETICLKCLQKDPTRRYASAAELADDLGRFLRGEPVFARPVSLVELGWKWVKRRPAVAAVWIVSIFAVLSLTATLIIANFRLQRERNAAQAISDTAMDAVNRHFTLLSEDALLNAPHMEPVRRQLLQEAKTYYEKLVTARGDDPRLRAELGRSHARLGKITGQLGAKDEARKHYLQAIATLEPVCQERPDALHQFALASAWNALGFIYVNMREMKPAADAYRQAIELAELLPRDQTESADYAQLLGQGLHGLGEVHRLSGQAEQAETRFREAWAAHQAAVNASPNVPKYQRDLAHTQNNLGVVAQMAGRPTDAETEYKEALALRESIAQAHPKVPQFQSAAAASLMNLGWLYYATGRTAEAESPWNRVLAIQEKLALTFPDTIAYQVEVAEARSNLGSLYLAMENWDAARQSYDDALRIRRQLVERFPADAEHRDGLAMMHNNLGALAGSTGDLARAETEFGEAAKIREALAREQPAVVKYHLDLGKTCGNLAKLKQSQGDNEGALAWFDRGIAALDHALATEPSNAHVRSNLVLTQASRAEARLALHRVDAITDWERVSQLEEEPKRKQWRIRRAHALARLGQRAEAYREAESLPNAEGLSSESSYYLACTYSLLSAESGAEAIGMSGEQCAAFAVEMIKRSQAAGHFKDAARREQVKKDPDLQALRDRDDFKNWLASLPKD